MEKFWLMIYLLSVVTTFILVFLINIDVTTQKEELIRKKNANISKKELKEALKSKDPEKSEGKSSYYIKLILAAILLFFVPGFNTYAAIALIVFYQEVIDKIISKWIENGGLR